MEFKCGSNLLQQLFICMIGGFWHKKKERENMALAAAGVKSEVHANMLIVEIKFTILLSKHTGR
jgi:hypothetical protein